MSETGDFLDSLLAEWFGESDHPRLQTSVLFAAPCEDSFADSVLDFDLSLLHPSSASSPTASVDPVLFVSPHDSLQVRFSKIEDKLGFFMCRFAGFNPARS